jgi:hypothetical protein
VPFRGVDFYIMPIVSVYLEEASNTDLWYLVLPSPAKLKNTAIRRQYSWPCLQMVLRSQGLGQEYPTGTPENFRFFVAAGTNSLNSR